MLYSYYVRRGATTPEEPVPGYYVYDDEEGKHHGPLASPQAVSERIEFIDYCKREAAEIALAEAEGRDTV